MAGEMRWKRCDYDKSNQPRCGNTADYLAHAEWWVASVSTVHHNVDIGQDTRTQKQRPRKWPIVCEPGSDSHNRAEKEIPRNNGLKMCRMDDLVPPHNHVQCHP